MEETKDKKQTKNINLFNKGLSTDTNEVLQPKGSYRFALNAIANTEEGNVGLLSNEPSNIECGELPIGFIPIGKCYIGDNETCLFLVNPETGVSEIGLFKDCTYQTYVNDSKTPKGKNRLNFNKDYWIQATYRLRKGCEKNIYFTDGLNPPRVVNLNNLIQHKNASGLFDADLFKIFKTADKIPQINISETKVLENRGSLKPGSYSIYVQYLDSDLNATSWIELINNIIIYNDNLNTPYPEITGSIYLSTEGFQTLQYDDTLKAIQIDIENINKDFPYIRYAIVEYTSGLGEVSSVKASQILSIDNTKYIYTGKNAETTLSIEELKLDGESINIDTAKHIEQINNRLILANIKDKQVKVHRLQKYASKIRTLCYVRDINMNTIGDSQNGYNNRNNPKHPLINYEGVGYMPGEIYCFGIQYIYKDGRTTPVFHIPGTHKDDLLEAKDLPQRHYNMSTDNQSSLEYIENTNCENETYWGNDIGGRELAGNKIRFHRFPTRKDLGINLFNSNKQDTQGEISESYCYYIGIIGKPKQTVKCKKKQDNTLEDPNCKEHTAKKSRVNFYLIKNSLPIELNINIDPDEVDDFIESQYTEEIFKTDEVSDPIVVSLREGVEKEVKIEFKEYTEKEYWDLYKTYNENLDIPEEGDTNFNFSYDKKVYISEEWEGYRVVYYKALGKQVDISKKVTYTNSFGVSFSNIELPSEDEIGEEIVGYQIVRLERTDNDSTILDTGVLCPTTQYKETIVASGYGPETHRGPFKFSKILSYLFSMVAVKIEYSSPNISLSPQNYINKKVANIISLKHRFQNVTPDQATRILEVGQYKELGRKIQMESHQDGLPGSSADGMKTTGDTSDNDGWTIKHAYRFIHVKYSDEQNEKPVDINLSNEGEELRYYNLNACHLNKNLTDDKWIVNPSMDERHLLVESKKDNLDFYVNEERYPYVYFYKDHKEYYSNFRSLPYTLCTPKIFTSDNCIVFGGDTYLSPLRVGTMQYLKEYQAQRTQDTPWYKRWLLPILGVVGLLLTPFTGGTSLGLWLTLGVGLIAASGVVFGIAATISMNKFRQVYNELWAKGVAQASRDKMIQWSFVNINQPQGFEQQMKYRDDTLGWFTDSIGDIWLESPINANLRVDATDKNTFMYPQSQIPDHDQISINNVVRIQRVTEEQASFFGSWSGTMIDVYADADNRPGRKEIKLYHDKIFKVNSDGLKEEYTGVPYPTLYISNPDYFFVKKLKRYYMLPLTYKYCSDCVESFPHRIQYSEQSFDEETSDNYLKFLPNNYRDIEGETGEITNIFRYNNNLYIHTEEALWLQPSSLQERVTGDIVTFIGTGSFFEVPPQKLVEDETGNSAGTRHKWASLKTQIGYFFISSQQGIIYKFDGKVPKPISNIGISKWFNENIKKDTLENDFISSYDNEIERVLFTSLNPDSKWTVSYDTTLDKWISFHSYTPEFYVNTSDNLYSWVNNLEKNTFWKHNNWGNYQTYYGKLYPHIVEYIINTSPIYTKVCNDITIQSKAQIYNPETKTYVEDLYTTFNKGIIYNDRQTTGELNFIVKDNSLYNENYLVSQVENNVDNISIIDRTEKNWFINDFRDIRVDYNQPIWRKVNKDIQKELNTNSLDIYKDWTQLESFRDKYLGVRLIFDKFADRNLITKFTYESESLSSH